MQKLELIMFSPEEYKSILSTLCSLKSNLDNIILPNNYLRMKIRQNLTELEQYLTQSSEIDEFESEILKNED